MTDGFSDQIVAGTQLAIDSIDSPNFTAGVSGWTINADGSVEFNDGIFRGTIAASAFLGSDFIINSAGLFFYSGTPALGNLISSIAPGGGGTDPFGNVYPQGLWVSSSGSIIAANVFADAGQYGGTKGTADPWHNMTLLNSWTNRGVGFARAAYRGVTSPPNGVEIVGEITHAAVSGSSVIATLPAAYTPNTGQVVSGSIDGVTTAQLYAGTTGNLTLFGLSSDTLIQFHGLVSLDAVSA